MLMMIVDRFSNLSGTRKYFAKPEESNVQEFGSQRVYSNVSDSSQQKSDDFIGLEQENPYQFTTIPIEKQRSRGFFEKIIAFFKEIFSVIFNRSSYTLRSNPPSMPKQPLERNALPLNNDLMPEITEEEKISPYAISPLNSTQSSFSKNESTLLGEIDAELERRSWEEHYTAVNADPVRSVRNLFEESPQERIDDQEQEAPPVPEKNADLKNDILLKNEIGEDAFDALEALDKAIADYNSKGDPKPTPPSRTTSIPLGETRQQGNSQITRL